jgi:acyl-[acyl-carrier-protein]-phospholipid O-acyltransferase/long-chain-fatty-acid--[acyl-carrier-protein] ligase
MSNQIHLLKTKRFLPLFITQFLGAFNDNVFKNALAIFVSYVIAKETGGNVQMMVTMIGLIFILPFFLFSALAGQIADCFDKAKIARIIKLLEIIFMSLAISGFYLHSINLLMIVLFLMGLHSTFFGPIKYGILPEHLQKDELVAANGLISSATFIAILLGTILGGLLIMVSGGLALIGVIILLCAIGGYTASCFIPTSKTHLGLKIDFNLWRQTEKIICNVASNQRIYRSIIGVSWFWFIGVTFLTQFPNFVKFTIGGDHQIITALLTIFSIGIAIGSVICNRILKGEITPIYVPISAILISIFTIDLFIASSSLSIKDHLIGMEEFIGSFVYLRIVFDLLMVAIFGGIYIVPLYALIQSESKEEDRCKNIAALNIFDSGFMVASAIFTVGLFAIHFTVPQVFLTVGLINILVAIYICKILPAALPKSIMQWLLFVFYNVEVKGLENYKKLNGNSIIVANHTSFLDAVLIASFLPDKFTFAVNTQIAQRWYFKPFFKMVEILPIDPNNPMAIKTMVDLVKKGKKLVIFPEGRLTMTGSLMKIYNGAGMIADKADAQILPICIYGASHTPFSRLKGRVKIKLFPKITLTILPPEKLLAAKEITGRARRLVIGNQLYDLMVNLVFKSGNYNKTLFASLIEAAQINGFNQEIAEDINFKPITYRNLIAKSFALNVALKNQTKPNEMVGVLLPNSNANLIVFFALQSCARVPAMLNFSTGINGVLVGCKVAKISAVISSRQFIEKAKLQEMVLAIENQGCKMLYLEDLASKINAFDKVLALTKSYFPKIFYTPEVQEKERSQLPCVVLFTSGSEGVPKGVVLSHKNIQANRLQLASKIDFNAKDIVLNALPMFHSFGLTGGTLLPILSGVKTFFYPSPLHYKIVPEVAYNINATILFGTNTFLNGYAKFAHPYDFYSIRYVFAGAEKVYDETRKIWNEKFGIRILEGYGATETAPIISANTPMQNRFGTVGKPMPSVECEIKKVEGIEAGGKLIVKAPNVMLGYLLADNPGEIQLPLDGKYDTGDIVEIDQDGYLIIKGRAKRFAKIAGEMVSLTLIETKISLLYPQFSHATINLPDDKKGEQIILLTTKKDASKAEILTFFKANGLTELMVPKNILTVDEIPLLGTGKIDYVKVKEYTKT